MSYVRNEWKENDIITAEKLNNTGIDDVLDLGVIEGIDPDSNNWNYNGDLQDNQIVNLDNYRFVKFEMTIEDGSKVSIYIPLFQRLVMGDIISYVFEREIISSSNYSTYSVQVISIEKKFYFNYSLISFN